LSRIILAAHAQRKRGELQAKWISDLGNGKKSFMSGCSL